MNYPVMYPVSSSNVAEVGYVAKDLELVVKFLDGSVYKYMGVPEHHFTNLKNAPSVGSYLHAHIKNVYPYLKIG